VRLIVLQRLIAALGVAALLTVSCGNGDLHCEGPPATSSRAAVGDSTPVRLVLRTEPMPCDSEAQANCKGWRHHLQRETDFDGAWWSIDTDLSEAEFLTMVGEDGETVPGRMTLTGDDKVQVSIDGTDIRLDATPTDFGCQ
jgi:hypothetical protein